MAVASTTAAVTSQKDLLESVLKVRACPDESSELGRSSSQSSECGTRRNSTFFSDDQMNILRTGIKLLSAVMIVGGFEIEP